MQPKRARRAESRCRYYVRELASQRGWDTRHTQRGGQVLEEQEIASHFPDIGLGLERPDFLFCYSGSPAIVVEAKNEAGKLGLAVAEAVEYADQIRKAGRYDIRIAVGAAGDPDVGFELAAKYRGKRGWVPLKAHGFELTSFPTLGEVELALQADTGTTEVTVPSPDEFIEAAIELSRILRTSKIEAPLRPKVIGAVVLAMYQGNVSLGLMPPLESINSLVNAAVNEALDLAPATKTRLCDALRLSGADFERLAPAMGRVVNVLRRLNIRSVIHTGVDFLGMFYEAFLRYGYDNNALGIVFTPRHITRMCVELTGIKPNDRVIDIACGTGGFLVAAFDSMIRQSKSDAMRLKVKSALSGFDTNPTVWALAMLNMFFRGDGKSHIQQKSCFDDIAFARTTGKFTRAYLNPPFSQDGEPEYQFIDRSMQALEPDGMMATVVKAGIFADEDHRDWRQQFLRSHQVLAVISLPEDLFYPTAAPTSILVARAHVPMKATDPVFLARVWNDGFVKLKGKRVESPGGQIEEVVAQFRAFMDSKATTSQLVTVVHGADFDDGAEWSPQEWLPQPPMSKAAIRDEQHAVLRAVFQAVGAMPQLAEKALDGFVEEFDGLKPLPYGTSGPVTKFFNVENGRSPGEKNFVEGDTPYVSSGDTNNSIIRLVSADDEEQFATGGLTVTAFGTASLQPWPFVARGNGGSAVRVLLPKYRMSVAELLWFAAQINLQAWRFFYARMSIKSRIQRLNISAPPKRLRDDGAALHERVMAFHGELERLSSVST